MLRSARELEQFRVRTADGQACGRIRDLYFDDSTWRIKYLVLSIEPSCFARKEVLLEPPHVSSVNDESSTISLEILPAELAQLPLSSAAPPVCKQYEALAYASPGARKFTAGLQSDPHLRSAKAVFKCGVEAGGEAAGTISDFIFDTEAWEIRYLAMLQEFERKALRFYILPQSVERITWATQRVVLRELNPVSVADQPGDFPTVAVA